VQKNSESKLIKKNPNKMKIHEVLSFPFVHCCHYHLLASHVSSCLESNLAEFFVFVDDSLQSMFLGLISISR
jgi:hypothetical protein